MDRFCQERLGHVCVIFHALFVQFPERGRFRRLFSAGHEELFFDSRSLAGSSAAWSPITQKANLDKLCLDPVQRQYKAVEGGFHSGNTPPSLPACPLLSGKKNRITTVWY